MLDKYILGWSGLNWKGKAAKVQQYYDQGKSEFSALEKMAAVGVGLKVFGVSTLWIVVLTPFIAVAAITVYAIVGYVWVQRGWYREKQEVSTMDGWSTMTNLQWRLLVALAQDRGISIKAQDVQSAPKEVHDVCLSKRPPAVYDPEAGKP